MEIKKCFKSNFMKLTQKILAIPKSGIKTDPCPV